MLVGRKQTPVSEALVWDHSISDFSLAFTAFFRNQTIRSNMLRQRFWRCLVCAGTEFAKIGFAFELMRFPFSKRDFLILRSRESPDCGSYGNGHIQWLPFLHSGTLYEFVMRLLLGGWSFDSVLHGPNHFQQVLISSLSCALIRFCGAILISMPIGHWTRTIFGIVQISLRIFFIRRRICSWFFHARTLLSCCLDPLAFKYDSRMVFTRIASPKVPFLTSSEADRAFQAVRNFDVELALFYSYHLDRFGYSVAASPANQ